MDTKNYIKMCEADEDLKWEKRTWSLGIWKIKYGDFRPSQEDIQRIIFKKNNFYDNLIKFVNFVNGEYSHFSMFAEKGTENKYKDFKELWFAFAMYEKYNKVWTGEKWIFDINIC